jgi:MFS-type transporter involved in bile tolerance (Atg22 family)
MQEDQALSAFSSNSTSNHMPSNCIPSNDSNINEIVLRSSSEITVDHIINTIEKSRPSPTTRFKNFCNLMIFGFRRGFMMQLNNMKALSHFHDLSYFFIAFIFLSMASSTASSVAIIVATQVLGVSIAIIIASAVIGLLCAILGMYLFKTAVMKNVLTPKYVLVMNIIVLSGLLLFILFIQSIGVVGVIIAAAVGGSQVGALSAFQRSIVSSLTPTWRQSGFFSLFQFSQEATGWIGSLVIATLTKVNGGGEVVYLRSIVFTCLVEIILGLPFLLLVNFQRGLEKRINDDEESNFIVEVSKEVQDLVHDIHQENQLHETKAQDEKSHHHEVDYI